MSIGRRGALKYGLAAAMPLRLRGAVYAIAIDGPAEPRVIEGLPAGRVEWLKLLGRAGGLEFSRVGGDLTILPPAKPAGGLPCTFRIDGLRLR